MAAGAASAAKFGVTDRQRLTAIQRPASALGLSSAVKEDRLYWRGMSHTIIPELLHGTHTKKMLVANEGLPSIADQVLVTSLASIIPAAAQVNHRLLETSNLVAADSEQAAVGTEGSGAAQEAMNSATVTAAAQARPRSKFHAAVATSKKVGMIAQLRKTMMQNLAEEYSNEEQLRRSKARIETLEEQVKSLKVALAAKETSNLTTAAIASADSSRQVSASTSEQPCAPQSSSVAAVHSAMVQRMEQLESSRDELRRQLVAFQDFAPVYKEILTILGQGDKKSVARTVETIEHLFDYQRTSSERILELQEKLEAAESDLKMMVRQKQVDNVAKEADLVNLKNQLEQQRGLTLQVGRQRDEAVDKRMQIESMMLQVKNALKFLAESWGCDTSLVAEAEMLVALLSQASVGMIGKSSAQTALQGVQGVINTTWLEVLHSYYTGTKLPGDPITGMRMIYECVKTLHFQNGNLSKNLKEARGQLAETREEIEKWRRARASGNAHDRKVLELQGVIRKDVSSQTDAQEEMPRERPQTSHSTPHVAKPVPLASAAAEAHQKVPAFHILSDVKASDVAGPPKWKRQLIAKARNQTAAAVSQHFV